MDYHSILNFLPSIFLTVSPGASSILVVFLLLLFLFSFFVAGSEVAFFSLSPKDVNILKKRKNPSFKRIVRLLEQPKSLLTSIQIANILVNIGIILVLNLLIDGWFGAAFKANHPFWLFIIKLYIESTFILLFAEVLPKVWATHHKVWFAAATSLLIEIFHSLFYGLSQRIVKYSEKIEKKLSVKTSGIEQSDLDDAIDLLPDHEASMEEKEILKGIRKFSDTTAKQVMKTRLDVSGIDASKSFTEILALTEVLQYSRIPIFKSDLDHIVGILHIKDLLPHLRENEDFDWLSLVRPPYFVHEQKLVEDLLQDFRSKRTHFAIVVDEFGGTSGIITLEDILEEIIGDIKDEFDDEESVNKKIDDYTYVFEGKTMINDVCKFLHLPANTFDGIRGDSDSLAGLVLEIAGAFPLINEELKWNNFAFITLEINKNRIEKVKMILPGNEKSN